MQNPLVGNVAVISVTGGQAVIHLGNRVRIELRAGRHLRVVLVVRREHAVLRVGRDNVVRGTRVADGAAEPVSATRVKHFRVGVRRQFLECRLVVHRGERELFEVVLPLGAGGGFAHLLHSGEEQADQDCNDRNHDEQLDECKRATGLREARHERTFLPVPGKNWGVDDPAAADPMCT